jgi:hypothetical protein
MMKPLKKKKYITGLVLAGMVLVGLQIAGPAFATRQPKVTICHRTNAVQNPYVRETVALSSVDGNLGDDHGQGDHFAEHKGPVASSEAVAQALKDDDQKWGDIIPPNPAGTSLNWDADGQAIYANDCNYVTPPPPPVLDPTATITPGTCDKPDTTVLLDNTQSTGAVTFDVNGTSYQVAAGESQSIDLGSFAGTVTVTVQGGEGALATADISYDNCATPPPPPPSGATPPPAPTAGKQFNGILQLTP